MPLHCIKVIFVVEKDRKKKLLDLFSDISGKTKIIEPQKQIHGTLRDRNAIEREITLIMREIIEEGYFKTKLEPRELARMVVGFYNDKNDTEIARSLGDEKLSKTVARARVRLKLFRELDFKMPFDRERLEELLDTEMTMKDIADELDVSPSSLREYRHVLDAEKDKTFDVYLERIRDVMEDRDLSEKMTRAQIADGLSEAIDRTEAELIDIS